MRGMHNHESGRPTLFVKFEAWEFLLSASRDFLDPQIGSLQRIHRVAAKAAPSEPLRLQNECASRDRDAYTVTGNI